jgi:hypothetical protein
MIDAHQYTMTKVLACLDCVFTQAVKALPVMDRHAAYNDKISQR